MPGVGGHLAGGGVVAGDGHHVGAHGHELGDDGVEGLDGRHLGVEVAVLAGGVGRLVVEEEQVVVVPVLLEEHDLLVDRGRRADRVHAHQAADAPVHRVDGDGRGPQAVALLDGGQLAVGVEAPQQDGVGLGLLGEDGAGPGGRARRSPRRCGWPTRVWAMGCSGAHAGHLGVGVVDVGVEVGAPQHDEHPVLGLVDEQHLDARDRHALGEQAHHLEGLEVGDAPGPAVGDDALLVDGGQVAAGGDVARVQVDVEAGGRQRPPAQVVVERVVAEQRQVGRARIRG